MVLFLFTLYEFFMVLPTEEGTGISTKPLTYIMYHATFEVLWDKTEESFLLLSSSN